MQNLKALTNPKCSSYDCSLATQNAALTMLNNLTLAQSLNPTKKICNLVSTTNKECWGELAGQEIAYGSSRIAKKPAALEGEG